MSSDKSGISTARSKPLTARTHEKNPTHTLRCNVRLRVRIACVRVRGCAYGRDTPLRTHRLWRDTYLRRLTHRHRLPLPLQRIKIKNMLIKLIRNQGGGFFCTGRLVINGRWFCNTLERVGYQIPAICYPVRVTQSPRFKRLLPIVQNVPQRSGIRFHRGSKPEHSTGCILVVADNPLPLEGVDSSGMLSKLSSNKNSICGRSAADVEQSLTQLLLQTQESHEEIILEVIDFRPGTDYGYDTPCPPELQKP